MERVGRTAERLGLACQEMQSGVGHDAIFMAGLGPSAMIFVPCEKGISYTEAEAASPDGLAAGAGLLTVCRVQMADRGV